MINLFKILIIFSFSILLLRHISFFYHKYKKIIIDDTNSKKFFFFQTPPLILIFFLMIYICEKHIIHGVLMYTILYFLMMKFLYYFIPYFPKNWSIRLIGGGKIQLILLGVLFILTSYISLIGINRGIYPFL